MKRLLSSGLLSILVALPLLLNAQGDARSAGYEPLIGIPGLDSSGYTTEAYVNVLYVLAISIAAFLAVVHLILAGLRYMFSDVVTDKSRAKSQIWSAFIGLLVVLGAVLILNTINPQLTSLNALSNLRTIQTDVKNFEVVIEPGTAADRRKQDPDAFTKACTGETIIYGDTLYCALPTTMAPGEYRALLDANDSLTEAEKENLMDLYISMPNSASLRTEDFPELLENEDLFTVINNRYTAEEFAAIRAPYVAEGMSEEDATTAAFEKVVRDEAIFIQVPGDTNQRLQERVRLCEAGGGEAIATQSVSGAHIVCI